MYIVIVGASKIGCVLASRLIAEDHEVVVIEQQLSRCAELEDELGGIVVAGDGTEVATLTKAGLGRAGAFIAATGSDDRNLMACQLAKHMFSVPHTASVASMVGYERLFALLGIDVVVGTTSPIVEKIFQGLSGVIGDEAEKPA